MRRCGRSISVLEVADLHTYYGVSHVLQGVSLAVGAGDSVERAAYRRLRHQTLSAERRALIALRDQGVISDEVLHRLEQELNVEAIRMGLGEAPLDD